MDPIVNTPRIALFIDIENLVGGASTIGLPIDIAPVLEKLKEHGRVQIRRSFGDLDKCLGSIRRGGEIHEVRRMLHKNLVQIEDIPFITANKNTADVTLVVEALSLAYHYPDISHFAVLASDRDYVPLYRKLQELGRFVIAIGVDQSNIHPMVREASDVLIYYETLFSRPTAPTPESEEDRKDLLNEYFEVLRDAVRALDNQGGKTVGTSVAAIMRQKRSDFSPQLAGCSGFKDFIDLAEKEGVVKVQKSDDSDMLIWIDSDAPILKRVIALPQPTISRDYSKLADYYKTRLEAKLRISLPPHKTRLQILHHLSKTYSELMQQGPFELREWSDETVQSMRHQPNGQQKGADAVYKILLSLHFARCFHCEESNDTYNPRIVGLAHGEDLWEQRLHFLYARTIYYEIRPDKIVPEALNHLFYGGEKGDLEKINLLLQEVTGG